MNNSEQIDQPHAVQEALKEQLVVQSERAMRIEMRLKSHILETELERAAMRGNAYNAAQIVALLKQ